MELVERRLAAQQISRHDFQSPRDLCAWLGAVQAQDWAASKWALGLRVAGNDVTDVTIEHAVDEGAVVRIHALRWTWQLVAPEDVRWLVALVAPRLFTRATRRHRELELDAPTIRKSNDAIVRALRGGAHLTRADLAKVLERAHVSPAGQRLPHLLALAELHGLAGSGARRGKHATWALLDERLPKSEPRDWRDAAAELARRYFESRGPATLEDFRWWSGLDAADARGALEAVAPALTSEVVSGQKNWFSAKAPFGRAKGTHLLPAFDEYLVAYKDRTAMLATEHVKNHNAGGGMLRPCIVHDGQVVGTWQRTLGRTLTIETNPFAPTTAAIDRAIAAASRRYAAFLGPVGDGDRQSPRR